MKSNWSPLAIWNMALEILRRNPITQRRKTPLEKNFQTKYVLAIKPPERKQAEEVTCNKSQQGRRDP